jgi:1-acyl-sn-glycerol-3-phosphate acyltransferase
MGSFLDYLRYVVYSKLYYVVLGIVSFLATFIGIVANVVGKRLNTNYYVARTFYYACSPIVGWRLDIKGEEHFKSAETGEQPAVIVGNHQR